MKLNMLLAGVLMSTVSLSGCTTSDWIQAVGGAAQARDDYGKKKAYRTAKKSKYRGLARKELIE
nr:hypothetical protein [uncultured Pseudomonas sp.]